MELLAHPERFEGTSSATLAPGEVHRTVGVRGRVRVAAAPICDTPVLDQK